MTFPSRNITHEQRGPSFQESKQSLVEKVQNRGNLPYITVDRQLELIEELSQFDLGKFLIERGGLNGYWIHYANVHPYNGRISGVNNRGEPFSSLERFLLEQAPVTLAAQERFSIFKTQIQKLLKEGFSAASIPSGLMADLLDLDFSPLSSFFLHGVDLDIETLSDAKFYAEEKGLIDHCLFSEQDAWDLGITERFDLITSNGLTIYEPSNDKVIALYHQFYTALKPGGVLVTSFLTPPPIPGLLSEWKLDQVNLENALIQKIVFSDILEGKWQVYRTEETVKGQLKQAGFQDLEVIYDKAHIFPSIVAKKPLLP